MSQKTLTEGQAETFVRAQAEIHGWHIRVIYGRPHFAFKHVARSRGQARSNGMIGCDDWNDCLILMRKEASAS